MKKFIPLILALSLLSGCTIQVWGKKEVLAIQSTPVPPGRADDVRMTALPPAVIPVLEAFFSGLFKFWGKSREEMEKTHRKAIEFDRPMRREREFSIFKVEE